MIFRILIILLCAFGFSRIHSQSEESDLKLFGYFQNSFVYETYLNLNSQHTTFNLQQLNLIFQTNINPQWTAFVNFKVNNTFSSNKQWGGISIDEAWIRYRHNQLNLKLGLQIPIFNHFNEIKDQAPLVPYVIKPLVYEDSYSEIISIEDFIPRSAFVQLYGFAGKKIWKFDYAFYIGNSPNIVKWNDATHISGNDSTDTFLFGGRVGIRINNLKAGVSLTQDQTSNISHNAITLLSDSSISDLVRRTRLGFDLSYEFNRFDINAEYIKVTYDEHIDELNFNKEFYYGTLGYYFNDKCFLYYSHWYNRENVLPYLKFNFSVNSIGFSYRFDDRITFKLQTAEVKFDRKLYNGSFWGNSDDFHHASMAVSVMF